MITAIREAIRRFVARNIVADDPYPVRSWLDQQNMPPEPRGSFPSTLRDATRWSH